MSPRTTSAFDGDALRSLNELPICICISGIVSKAGLDGENWSSGGSGGPDLEACVDELVLPVPWLRVGPAAGTASEEGSGTIT